MNRPIDELIHETLNHLADPQLESAAEVKNFYQDLMYAVWNYKCPGMLFEFYGKDIHVYRENGNDLHGIFAVVRYVAELEAAFPDISVRIDSIVVAENPKSGFQIWARNYFNGTHLGCSRYGAPTGKKLEEDRCMALSMLKLEKIEQRWKIIREETMFSDTMLCGILESHLIL